MPAPRPGTTRHARQAEGIVPDPAAAEADLALVKAARAGDRDAINALLARYQARIYGLCFRMVNRRDKAEDLAQDALVKLIQNLDRFDGRAQFGTWAYRITMNVCISHLRAERLRRHPSLDAPRKGLAGRPDENRIAGAIEQRREPAAILGVQGAEDRQRLLQALDRLDDEQRAILLLRDSRGLDYDQIAEVLGVPTGTVKSRLFRARQALRDAMEPDPKHD